MSATKMSKCYRKSEVKVEFREWENQIKQGTGSFREDIKTSRRKSNES